MNGDFVKNIYASIVEDNAATYKRLFEEVNGQEITDEYWKKAQSLYDSLEKEQGAIFFDVIKQVITDTVSNILGVFDGTCAIDNKDWDLNLQINGKSANEELQDAFLAYVEETE